VLCSGKLGAPALEDVACAGLLVETLQACEGRGRMRLGPGAADAVALYRAKGDDLAGFVAGVEHGRYLARIGMGRDVPYCAQVDVFDLVPRLEEDGIIRCGGQGVGG
jgi:2-phosphosulfolactate phosphatase